MGDSSKMSTPSSKSVSIQTLVSASLLLLLLSHTTTAFVTRSSSSHPTVHHHLPTTPANARFQKSSTALLVLDADDTFQTTALQRYRTRKVNILKKRKTWRTTWLFGAWYVLSVLYNILSKASLNLAPSLAWTTASLQMAGGLSYVVPIWLLKLRKVPRLTPREVVRLSPVALLHSLVHIGGVVSMGAGAVSFTYIVKASEPAVSAVLLAFTGQWFSPSVYVTLLPVIAGVSLVSVNELTFSWKSFGYAMMSNVASASRGVVGKRTINQRLGQNMNAANLYAILTLMSTCLLAVLATLMEGPRVWKPAFAALASAKQLLPWMGYTLGASIFYYTYNEVAFLCLDNVSPVSHAIANTVKRIFIIASSMLVFGNQMTWQGILGSCMAIGGVLWYSLEKQRYKQRKRK